jgi:3-deoxy-D-manno-octulosonate 8-phosphate phosphatase (KDO 8-P phosphatase)
MGLLEAYSVELIERARRITTVVLDVDGVLTDGRIIYDEDGDELKHFDVQDGAGLVFWHRAGLKSAIITARKAKLIKRRAKELHIDFLRQRALVKLPVYEGLLKRWKLSDEQMCVIGDDLMELPLLRRAGLAVAVPNAVEEVRAISHYVTSRPGGRGAVREVIDLLLKANGSWDQVIARYGGCSPKPS